jgi:hypothetical protein
MQTPLTAASTIKTKVTIDTNCIIGLEEERDYAPIIRDLIQMNKSGDIQLQVVAISASEKQPDGRMAENYSLFRDRLKRSELDAAKVLHPPMILGITYLGSGRLNWREMIIFRHEVHSILWPNSPEELKDFEKTVDTSKPGWQWKWRNKLCDTLAYACHLEAGGGLFVSNDNVFHGDKKDYLLSLFGGEIVKPIDAKTRLLNPAPFHSMPKEVENYIAKTYVPGDPITDSHSMKAFKIKLGIPT